LLQGDTCYGDRYISDPGAVSISRVFTSVVRPLSTIGRRLRRCSADSECQMAAVHIGVVASYLDPSCHIDSSKQLIPVSRDVDLERISGNDRALLRDAEQPQDVDLHLTPHPVPVGGAVSDDS
jgi:hypothetical protein